MGFLDDMEDEVRDWLPSNDAPFLAGVDLFANFSPPPNPQEEYLSLLVLQQAVSRQVTQQFGPPAQHLGQLPQGYGQALPRFQQALAQAQQPYRPRTRPYAFPDFAETLNWNDTPYYTPQPLPNATQPHSLPRYQANTFGQQHTSPNISRPSKLCQRRGAVISPIDTSPLSNTPIAPRRDAISEPADPLANATQVEIQVLRSIVERLEAQGTQVDVSALDAGSIGQLFQNYATTQERAAIDKEQADLVAVRAEAERAQAGIKAQQRSEITRTSEEAWQDEYRRQLSPGRRADGTADPAEDEVTYEEVTKYDRPQLQRSCVDCRREKRKCDRKDTPDNICSGCMKKEEKYPDKYVASDMCYPDANEAYLDFVNDRAALFGKAVRTDSGWQTKRYRDRKVREDAKKAAKEQ